MQTTSRAGAGGAQSLVRFAADGPNNVTQIPVGSPQIVWETVREDTVPSMYDGTTGIFTIPSSGLWSYSVHVAIDQSSMGSPDPSTFPSTFYQHIFSIVKDTAWPEGFTFRVVDFYQARWSVNPQASEGSQILLKGTDTVRLNAGDQVSFQISTLDFSFGGEIDTFISGFICLNCVSWTRIGD